MISILSRKFTVAMGTALLGCCAAYAQTSSSVSFSRVTIEPDLGRLDFVLAVADLNGDGRDDILAGGRDGSPDHRRHAPTTGGGLRTAVSYARQIGLNDAATCSSSPTSRPGSGNASRASSHALGALVDTGAGAIDFYRAAKQLSDAVKCVAGARFQRRHAGSPDACGCSSDARRGRGDHGPAGAVPRAHTARSARTSTTS